MSDAGQRPPVRVALMGLGRSMLGGHCPALRALRGMFDVVAACDLSKERRDIVARDWPKCRMFRRFEDMLDERNIELVDIATCTSDHVRHALMSLDRGFWTMLETPIAVTPDESQVLRGAAAKAKGRLIAMHRAMFAPDFMLARAMASDPRLGEIYQVRIRREDYVRRDDWQTVNRLGGGAAYYAMADMVLQALKLLPVPPMQMWSELKRVASLGDSEDYAHVVLRTRTQVSADIEFNGGVLAPCRGPSFVVRGSRGEFSARPGETSGRLVAVDPAFHLPRRRASVRTPPLADMHEDLPILDERIPLPEGSFSGAEAFWRAVYAAVRTAVPFPVPLEDSFEAVKFAHLMKKTSPFGG